MTNVLVAGTPFGLQIVDAEGEWLTEAHRVLIQSLSRDIRLEHISARDLHNGAKPTNTPDVVMLETSGTVADYESLPGLIHRSALDGIVTDSLKWFHSCSAGVEHILPILPDGVPLTNASGVHSSAIAEVAVAGILSHAKQFDRRRQNQANMIWAPLDCRELGSTTVSVIGVGKIGSTVARMCKSFDMRVVGVATSARKIDNFDVVYPTTHLDEALRGATYVVVACPLTSATRGLLGARELAQLGSKAYIINVARGPIIDEPALLDALSQHQIDGALHDAFDAEPLADDSPFWKLPNVRLLPHDSHASQRIGDNQIKVFADNLRRFIAGEELHNVIDPSTGY
jgi:phosphoglycerate dehydrogenase-like enzyme